jgi:hypothetical protein
MKNARFNGHLSNVVISTGNPRREIDEFAKLASASGESIQGANRTPVVVNNSGQHDGRLHPSEGVAVQKSASWSNLVELS